MNRRDFFKLTGTCAGGLLVVPEFLYSYAMQDGLKPGDNCVVFIQLLGGNDGLNTFIPYNDDLYYALRPNISIAGKEIIDAGQKMGWHPVMQGFAEMQQKGHLSVIQNVGYPGPARSHFRGQEIWQTASASNEFVNDGWLGRFMDHHYEDYHTLGALNVDSVDNLALKGVNPHAVTLTKKMGLSKNEDYEPVRLSGNPQLDFVRKIAGSISSGSSEIREAMKNAPETRVTYPQTSLGKNMDWISHLIQGGLNSRIYYTTLDGFDTHAQQLARQYELLRTLNDAVFSFYRDMEKARRLDEITIVIFSEFGRRVADNGKGTDHGAAAPMFVIGGKNKGRMIGNNPDLANLDHGDLRHEIDFRSVYASLLRDKFSFNPKLIGINNAPLKGLFS